MTREVTTHSFSSGKVRMNTNGRPGNMNAFIYGNQRSGSNRVGSKRKRKIVGKKK